MLRGAVILGVLAGATSHECKNDFGCELNGVCRDGKCLCDAEWEGNRCNSLRLGKPSIAYGGPDSQVTSWGAGPPVKDPKTGKWYLFVTEIGDHCGLSEWQRRSTVVRVVADTAEGPYTRQGVVIPAQAHNPYYVFDEQTQTHLIYHIGKGDSTIPPRTDCLHGTTPPPGGSHRRRARSKMQPEEEEIDPEQGEYNTTDFSARKVFSMKPEIHMAKSLTGEWTPVDVKDGSWNFDHVPYGFDNPAPYIFPNGSVLLLTRRYMGAAGSQIYLSRASSFEGPYTIVQKPHAGDFSPSDGNHEDPCIWMDKRGHFHALFHFGATHAFSADGVKWHFGSDNAWTGGVLPDGLELRDAERPKVMFDQQTGRPELLFFASGGLSQPVKQDGKQKGFTVVRKILH